MKAKLSLAESRGRKLYSEMCARMVHPNGQFPYSQTEPAMPWEQLPIPYKRWIESIAMQIPSPCSEALEAGRGERLSVALKRSGLGLFSCCVCGVEVMALNQAEAKCIQCIKAIHNHGTQEP